MRLFYKKLLIQFYIPDAVWEKFITKQALNFKKSSWVQPKSAIERVPSSFLHLSHLSIQGRGGKRDKRVEKRKSERESSRGIAKNTPLA